MNNWNFISTAILAKLKFQKCRFVLGEWKNKKMVKQQLIKSKSAHNLESSDEKTDECSKSPPYSWESGIWRTVKETLDNEYLEILPFRSRRFLQKKKLEPETSLKSSIIRKRGCPGYLCKLQLEIEFKNYFL